jgi:hypothetical protein
MKKHRLRFGDKNLLFLKFIFDIFKEEQSRSLINDEQPNETNGI